MRDHFCPVAGKEAFASAAAARAVLERRRRKRVLRRAPLGKLGVYRCRDCSGWHLGNAVRVPAPRPRPPDPRLGVEGPGSR